MLVDQILSKNVENINLIDIGKLNNDIYKNKYNLFCVQPFELTKIDFTKFADALGIESRNIENDKDLDQVIQWAIKSSEPVLLSIAIDPNEIFPPLRTKIEQRRRDLMGKI